MKLVHIVVLSVGLMSAPLVLATAPDFDQAVKLHRSGKAAAAASALEKLARKGDANAQAYLGAMYGVGDGVKRDTGLALKWQLKAAEQGHVLAQYNAAVLLARGDKNSRDLKEAAKWFQKAGEAGLPEAQLHMGLMHEKGWGITRCPYEASKWYHRAGMSFLAQNNVKMAVHARDKIIRLLPDYYLATQLTDEIFLHGASR